MKPQLPKLSPQAVNDCATLTQQIQQKINTLGGFMPFVNYMNWALYAPKYGYYSGRNEKIGRYGDFATAPQLTDLFGKCLSQQIEQILPQTLGNIYEFGAGTGKLAVDIIQTLPENAWQNYYIIELSADLQQRQRDYIQQKIPQYANKIKHLDRLPETFDGFVFGNEVLDAMPCEVVEKRKDGIYRMGVTNTVQGFDWASEKATGFLLEQAAFRLPESPTPYRTEINLQAEAFVRTLAERLNCGGMLFIDYGFDRKEYYHPQRTMGTLIGHYRHHTVDNPFVLTGQMDLTAHIDFSAIADAATSQGIDFIGYTTQAAFLLSCGITDFLADLGDTASETYIKTVAAVQKLLNPHEMGELFKCIAFGKNIDPDWLGFNGLDLSAKL
ncbi:MAG: SAM-dependent methyltransferase [Neisseriaceae bacterium]|nr:SAM-dependent methyltransferase [Neisseriaceae bacterium]